MRTRFAAINSVINLTTYLILIIPTFWYRKIFLNSIGEDFLGLHSFFQNVIGFLSLAELGVGAAILYALYRPIAENDHNKIHAYLQFYKKAYWLFGGIVLIIGALLVPFFPSLIKSSLNTNSIIISYFLFLASTILSYLFSSKISLLNASQQGYIVTIVNSCMRLLTIIIQMISLKLISNYFVVLVIQIISDSLYYLIMHFFIGIRFPWLSSAQGTLTTNEKKALFKNIRAVFFHKIGFFAVTGTNNLIISAFINLTAVARFNNYYMVIGALSTAVDRIFDGVSAGIGSLLTDNNPDHAYTIHKNFFFINFIIISFSTILLYNTLNQFIGVWLGPQFTIDPLTESLLLFNFYFKCMRISVERFKQGGGLYQQDQFAPLIEAAINLCVSIYFVKRIGLPGVMLGTVFSNLLVVFWIKPRIVYKYIFKKPLSGYFLQYAIYFSITALMIFISHSFIIKRFNQIYTIKFLLFNSIITTLFVIIVYFIIFYSTSEFKYAKNIITKYVESFSKVVFIHIAHKWKVKWFRT